MSDNEAPTAAQQALDGADQVMKPYNVGAERINQAWNKLSTPNESPKPCIRCAEPTSSSINGVCYGCFCASNGMKVERPPQSDVPSCNFCGRDAKSINEMGGTVVAAPDKKAHLCSNCAAAAASCIGARTAAEARAMMAQANLQAEAVKQCCDYMQRTSKAMAAEHVNLDEALNLATLSEVFARIARGGA